MRYDAYKFKSPHLCSNGVGASYCHVAHGVWVIVYAGSSTVNVTLAVESKKHTAEFISDRVVIRDDTSSSTWTGHLQVIKDDRNAGQEAQGAHFFTVSSENALPKSFHLKLPELRLDDKPVDLLEISAKYGRWTIWKGLFGPG